MSYPRWKENENMSHEERFFSEKEDSEFRKLLLSIHKDKISPTFSFNVSSVFFWTRCIQPQQKMFA